MMYYIFMSLNNCLNLGGRGAEVMTLVICDPVPFIQVVDECQSDCTEAAPTAGSELLVAGDVHSFVLFMTIDNWSNLILSALVKWYRVQEILQDKNGSLGIRTNLIFYLIFIMHASI